MNKSRWNVTVAVALLGGTILACASGSDNPPDTLAPPAATLTVVRPDTTATDPPPTAANQPAATSTTLPSHTPTVAAANSPVPLTTDATLDPNLLGTMQRDVTYCTVDGMDLKMDVLYPSTQQGPSPVAVYVHGGGWSEGDKSEGEIAYIPALGLARFILISVNYRLAPQYKFPAQIEDVKCAIRHLRAKSRLYNLDPVRIGAWGTSAGGHLAALLGLTDATAGWTWDSSPTRRAPCRPLWTCSVLTT